MIGILRVRVPRALSLTTTKTMNAINDKQYTLLWNALDEYTEYNNTPEFWSLYKSECGRFLIAEVQDFDGRHDFGFLRDMLESVGVRLNEADMLSDYDLARLEREEEPRPLQAAILTGDGEHGRLYGYELIFEP